MATRVVIVDDDVWVRTGRSHALAEREGIEVLASLDHSEALARPALWDVVDVVLVDAWDHRAGFDRFPGVAVVRAIRSHPRSSAVRIIVVTGHVVNEMLRLRMAQAGADFFFGHEEVADPERLATVVLECSAERGPGRRGPDEQGPDDRGPDERLRDPGVIPADADPDAALDWVRAHDAGAAFTGESQKALPVSRRALGHIRREVGARAGLGAHGRLPPWRQVAAFVNRARGADLEGPGVDRRRPRGGS